MNKDYRNYQFSGREKIRCMAEGIVLLALLAYLFFDSVFFMVPGCGLLYLYSIEKKRWLIRRRMSRMRKQFKDFLEGFSGSLQTGRSVENAFSAAVGELRQLYGTKAELIDEFQAIAAAVALNGRLEVLLQELSVRCPMEELEYFSQVFSVAKHSGGNLISVMRYTSGTLKDRMDIQNEIHTIIFQKELEFYIMSVIPLAMIVYFRVSMPGFFESLYGNFTGIITMTVCLGIYGGCFFYGRRMLEVES